MTEVKVGQVWHDTFFGDLEVIAQSDAEVIFRKECGNFLKIKKDDTGWEQAIVLVKNAEPEVSDLEIVQKALISAVGLKLLIEDDAVTLLLLTGEKYKELGGVTELLAWAKQQLGE